LERDGDYRKRSGRIRYGKELEAEKLAVFTKNARKSIWNILIREEK
jgi:hypothetical protein